MPSKKKKQKTKHTASGELSQAEIWDDTALVRSWNDAVAEYDFYHSIHARGEDVEEILRKAEAGELDDEDDAEMKADHGWQPVPSEVDTSAAGGAPQVGESEDEEGEIVDSEPSLKGQVQHWLERRRKAAMQQRMLFTIVPHDTR